MNGLISKSDTKKLMEELFSKADQTQDKFKYDFLRHSESTYKIAKETACDIIRNDPKLKIYSYEVAIAGYLHDIGRPLSVNQNFHEIRGALYIKNKGYEVGIAENKRDLERLAQMIMPHFIVYEEFLNKNYSGWGEFSKIDALILLPKSIEQKIIVYADLSNRCGIEMNFRERLKSIRKNRFHDRGFMNAFERGEKRIIEVCEEIELLRKN